jgi:hypothetical protein
MIAVVVHNPLLPHLTGPDYTAGPRYLEKNKKGGHEWIIEFKDKPEDEVKFCYLLDNTIKAVNSDYESKRYKDIALEAPVVHVVPEGTFYRWMKKRGKLGGQNKVPRLSNSREYIEDILEMMKTSPL